MKCFHNFANYRRNRKFIWEIIDEVGLLQTSQKNIMEAAKNYFKKFFNESNETSITNQVKVVEYFPKMVIETEAENLYNPVGLEELRKVLKSFKVDKSPGPDGWTVEFFVHFLDLVGEDLLNMVEETRLKGKIYGGLNSTFIALIHKVNKPIGFGDYRTISLCNLYYKIISKIITNRIKPCLSNLISKEQLGFLKGRHIQDAIGIVQECLHSIRKKKLKDLVLKLDLQKAYDCVSCDLLRIILIQVGLGTKMTNWIMSCMDTTTFAILVNGEALGFFKGGRGMRQGCPLSPLLFILVMEALSILLKESHREGKLSGI
jgi:hypothetical protein